MAAEGNVNIGALAEDEDLGDGTVVIEISAAGFAVLIVLEETAVVADVVFPVHTGALGDSLLPIEELGVLLDVDTDNVLALEELLPGTNTGESGFKEEFMRALVLVFALLFDVDAPGGGRHSGAEGDKSVKVPLLSSTTRKLTV